LFGFDLRRQNLAAQIFSATPPPIDVFNSTYGLPTLDFREVFNATQNQTSLGIYAQNLISFSDNFKVLIGGRFDLINQQYRDKLEDISLSQQDDQFSPRVGIVYQPIPSISIYGSWSRSFFAEDFFGSLNPDGTPFKPTTGEQFEVGVKTEFLDGKLAATLAVYEITKQNVITTDPERPDFSIQVGEQRSRGIEFDIAGQILPGLNLIASYAYTDAEITKDNSGFQGNTPNNVPLHSGSVWATYQIQRGPLKGLGFGAGVFIVGNRQADLENTFELPGYTRTDASIFYRRDRWRVQLNVKNLFGVNYFESASSRNSVSLGAPFSILGTVSVSF
jgi:iron complex outermembrane receptor protein